MNKGVEAEDIKDEKDNIKEQIEQFMTSNGQIHTGLIVLRRTY